MEIWTIPHSFAYCDIMNVSIIAINQHNMLSKRLSEFVALFEQEVLGVYVGVAWLCLLFPDKSVRCVLL